MCEPGALAFCFLDWGGVFVWLIDGQDGGEEEYLEAAEGEVGY